MEEVQKMKAQPQILLHQKISLDQIKKNVAGLLGLQPPAVFFETFPTDADFDALFENGYVLVYHFDRGTFRTRLDGFLNDRFMRDDTMMRISESLETLVCVDGSISEREPHFDAFFQGVVHRNVSVSTLEGMDGDPYYESEQIERILGEPVA